MNDSASLYTYHPDPNTFLFCLAEDKIPISFQWFASKFREEEKVKEQSVVLYNLGILWD